jgi:DNA-binding CsgD family transcriptional regulator
MELCYGRRVDRLDPSPFSPRESMSGLDRLTPGQRDVLALVAQYKSSKEIARLLSISPHTVDQRLKRVQAILGVASRFEAARLFVAEIAQVDGRGELWEGLVYQVPDLSPRPGSASVGTSPGRSDQPDGGYALHQTQAAYADAGWMKVRPWHAVLTEAGRTNDLTPLARTLCIGGLALIAIMSLAAIVSLAEGLSRIF